MANSFYEFILAILATGITTGATSTLITLWVERKKRSAEREAIITEAATKVIDELQQERTNQEAVIKRLSAQIDKLELGDQKTDELLKKYYLALSIIVRQLRMVTKFNPLVDPDKIEILTIAELNEIRRSMSEDYYRKIIQKTDD